MCCHPVYSGRQTTSFSIICGRTSRVTQEEGHTGFFFSTSCGICRNFFSREGFSRPFSSSTVKSNLCTHESIVLHLLGVMREKIPVRGTAPRFELTSQRQKVSRLPSEPPGRPSYISAAGDGLTNIMENHTFVPRARYLRLLRRRRRYELLYHSVLRLCSEFRESRSFLWLDIKKSI